MLSKGEHTQGEPQASRGVARMQESGTGSSRATATDADPDPEADLLPPPGPRRSISRSLLRRPTVRPLSVQQLTVHLVRAGPLALGIALWAWSLRRTEVADLGGFGLAAAVPWMFWAALGLIVLGFVGVLRSPAARTLWPAAYTVGLLLIQRATQALVYPTPLYAWTWKHLSIIDRLLANGGHLDLSNRLAAMAPYDQWAGFFAGNAALVRTVGLRDALGYAAWAPFVSSLLLVLPLLLVFSVFSRDRRLVWTAVWIFFLGDWVGQDYLSPQAFAFFLYLGVLALVLRNLARDVPPGRHGDTDTAYPLSALPRPALPTRERVLWLLLLATPVAALAMAHQLTPVVLGVALLVLLLVPRYRNPWAAALVLIVPAVWDATSALDFFKLQLPAMAQAFGNLLANSTPGDGSSPTGIGPETVAWLDRGLSAAVVALAGAGLLRHPPLRRRGLPLLLVSAAPLPLAVANSYGGEMVFRVFMFALPGLSFFAAAALFPRPRPASADPAATGPPYRTRPQNALLSLAVLGLLSVSFVPSYTGKDRTAYFPPDEIRLVDALVAQAPAGSFIVGVDVNFPEAYRNYDRYQYEWLSDATGPQRSTLLAAPAAYLIADMSWVAAPAHAYLVITRGQESDVAMQGVLPPGSVQRIEQSVEASPDFRRILQNGAGVVYEFVPPPPTSQTTSPTDPAVNG